MSGGNYPQGNMYCNDPRSPLYKGEECHYCKEELRENKFDINILECHNSLCIDYSDHKLEEES